MATERRTMTLEEAMAPVATAEAPAAPAAPQTMSLQEAVGGPAPQPKQVLSLESVLGLGPARATASGGQQKQVLSLEGALGIEPAQPQVSGGQRALETFGTLGGLISNAPPPAQQPGPKIPTLRVVNPSVATDWRSGDRGATPTFDQWNDPSLTWPGGKPDASGFAPQAGKLPKMEKSNEREQVEKGNLWTRLSYEGHQQKKSVTDSQDMVSRVTLRRQNELRDMDASLREMAFERVYGEDARPKQIEMPDDLTDDQFLDRYMQSRRGVKAMTALEALEKYRDGDRQFKVPNERALDAINRGDRDMAKRVEDMHSELRREFGLNQFSKDNTGQITLFERGELGDAQHAKRVAEEKLAENPNQVMITVDNVRERLQEGDEVGALKAAAEGIFDTHKEVATELVKGDVRATWQVLMPGMLETIAAVSSGSINDPNSPKAQMQGIAEYMRAVGGDHTLESKLAHTDLFEDPSLLVNPSFYARVLGEQTPIMAAMIAAGPVGGAPAGLTIGFGVNAGNYIAQTRAELIEQGYSPEQADAAAKMEGINYGIVASALEYAPLAKWIEGKELVGKGLRSVMLGRVRQAVAEGSTEALQSVAEDVVRVTGGGDPKELSEIMKKAFNEGFAGAVGGGALGQPTRSDSSLIREAMRGDATTSVNADAVIQRGVTEQATANTTTTEPVAPQGEAQPVDTTGTLGDAENARQAEKQAQADAITSIQPDTVTADGTTSIFTGGQAKQRAEAYAETLRGEAGISDIAVESFMGDAWKVTSLDKTARRRIRRQESRERRGDRGKPKKVVTLEEVISETQAVEPTETATPQAETTQPENVTAQPEQVAPQAGERITLMGKPVVVRESSEFEGVRYELSQGEDGSGTVRVLDTDSNQAATIRRFPDFEQAKTEYQTAVRVAGEPEVATQAPQAAGNDTLQAESSVTQAKQPRRSVKIPRQFTLGALERKLGDKAKAMPSALEAANTRMAAEFDTGNTSTPEARFGVTPEDIAHMLPMQKARIASVVPVHEDYSEVRTILGDQQYQQVIDEILGGDAGRARRYIDALNRSGQGNADPQDVFNAYVYNLARDAYDREDGPTPQTAMKAEDLIEGDKFTIHGEEFTVEIDEDGEAILKDGITVPAPDEIPVDQGSFKRAEIEGDDPFGAADPVAPGRVAGQQGSLLGERSLGGITGSQAKMFGDTSDATEQRTESEEDAKIRRNFDETATPIMFDSIEGDRDNSPVGARRRPGTGAGRDAFGPNNQRPMVGVAKAEVTIPKVIKHLEAMTGTPIRAKYGKFARTRSLGWWDTRNNRIRVKVANDMVTIAHEIGHSIHDRWIGGKMKFDPATEAELNKMGRDLYGNRKPNGGYLREGVAEYVRFRLLRTGRDGNPVDVATRAPNFHRWFNEEFLANDKQRARHMAEAERLYQAWDAQGALARVDAQIHRIPRGLGRLKSAFERLTWTGLKTLWNDAAPLEAAERRLRKEQGLTADMFEAVRRGELDPIASPSFMRAALKMSAQATARAFIEQSAVDLAGDKVGDSLADILRPIYRANKLQEWTIYAYARRALDLHTRGINPGISKDDSTYVVETLKSDEFNRAMNGITRWSNALLDYLIESGGLSEEAADTIRSLNPVYIPLQRHFDTDFLGQNRGASGSKGVVNQGQAVKRIKGSFRQVIDPVESLAQMAENIISRANKIRVARAIPELIRDNPGSAWFAQKIDPGDTIQEIRLEDIASQLKAIGVDLGDAELDQILTVFQNAGQRNFGKDNVVGVWREGKQEFYELDKDVYRVLTDMDKDYIPVAVRWLAAPATRLMRLGATGLNAGFSFFTNPVRDAMSLPIYSRYGIKTPLGSLTGFWDEMRKSPESQKWAAMGGPMANIMGQDRIMARRAVDEALASTLTDKVVRTFKHPIDAARAMFSLPENAPRIAEFKAALRKAEEKWGRGSESAAIEALMASKDVTVNFTRMGLATGPMNALYPFFNAQAQSVDKFVRTFAGSPGKATLRASFKAVQLITLPTLLLWMLNRDEDWYNELQDWEWQGYWHFSPDGGDTIFRIPKPFELGYVFGTVPEASLREMYGKDKGATIDAIEQTGMNFLPLKSGWDTVPQVAKPIAEAYMNRSAFPSPRDIDSRGDMNKLPEDRFNEYTTETSKLIGKFLGVSPKRIDHVIRGYTGGMATNIARFVEATTGIKESDGETELADLPVVGRAVRRNVVGRAASVDDLFEMRDELKQKKGSNKLEYGEAARLRRVERAIKQIQSIRDRHDAGKIEDDAAQRQIVQVARQALKR